MSTSMDLEPNQGENTPRPDRTNVLLTVLVAILLFVAVVAVFLIVQQRNHYLATGTKPTATAVAKQAPATTVSQPVGTQTAKVEPVSSPTQPAPTVAAGLPTSTPVAGKPFVPVPLPSQVVGVTPVPTPRLTTTVPPSPVAPAPPPAAPTQARSWFFAEGASVPPFRTWYSVLNPGNQAANVEVALYPENANVVRRTIVVPPGRQTRVLANELLPNSVFGAAITSDQPVYAERLTMGDRDGTTSSGVALSKVWYFPEGETGEDFTTWLLVLNQGSIPANLTVTYMIYRPETTTQPVVKTYTAPPGARLTIDGRKDVPSDAMGIMITSDQPIAAEESLYFDSQKAAYGGSGLTVLSKTWYVASGNTQTGFSTRIAVLNPNSEPAVVKVKIISSKQGVINDSMSLPARTKDDLILNIVADEQLMALILEADQPIAAQTVAYYIGSGSGPVAAYTLPASPAPAQRWFLPETMSAVEFDSYLMLFNPGSTPATITVSYLLDQAEPIVSVYDLAALSRTTLKVSDEIKGKTGVAVVVNSTQPVVAERVTMFRGSVGATSAAGIPVQ